MTLSAPIRSLLNPTGRNASALLARFAPRVIKSRRRGPPPQKPYDGFPLHARANGTWCKKIAGVHKSFGPWKPASDPDAYKASWRAALANFRKFDEARARGETIATRPGQIRLAELIDRYLAARAMDERRGDLSARTFVDMRGVLIAYRDGVGADRTVDALEADPSALRVYLDTLRDDGRLGWAAFNRSMGYIVGLWRWAAKPTTGLLVRPFHWIELHRARPVRERRRQQRQARSRGESPDFTIEEIRALIKHAGEPLRAMILLAYFCGYGNGDLAELPRTALEVFDVEQALRFGGRVERVPAGWAKLHNPRPKTELDRMAIVPPIVVDALREADRLMPVTDATRHLLLRSELGTPLQTAHVRRDGSGWPSGFAMTDNVLSRFRRLQRRLGTCPVHGIVAPLPNVGGRGRKRIEPRCSECGSPLTPMRVRRFYMLRHAAMTAAAASGASSDTRDLFAGHSSGSVRQAFYINPAQLHDLVLIARELSSRLSVGEPDPASSVA